jgi:hypothetical protein
MHLRPACFVTLISLFAILLTVVQGHTDERIVLEKVPHIVKKPDFGGETCVAMCLQWLGADADQDMVFDASNVEPDLGRGCITKELADAAKRLGFDVGDVWHRLDPQKPEASIQALLNDCITDLKNKIPSVVCMRETTDPSSAERFYLLIGYDKPGQRLIYHDPNRNDGSYASCPMTEFIDRWKLKSDDGQLNAIRLRMNRTKQVHTAVSSTFTRADYAQHIRTLKNQMPEGFTFVIQYPFVVIGDESPETVKQRSVQTVKWAVDRLKKQYFKNNPKHIVNIWLFKDKESYTTNAWELFKDRPSTPYGYYSSTEKVLVMNISTGGGTLVHEIVHPFIESNFPQCPSWFNEGLASLYEQSRDNRGDIWGSTNWRLRGLQTAIREGRLGSFRTLCSTTREEFYSDNRGTNYAQARYLCYYLQEKGLLNKFYHQFVKDVDTDPTGYKTLQSVLGREDIDVFQKQWQEFVMQLKF